MLELALYDKDVVTQDDHLFTVYFDIAKLSLGEQVFMHFKCDSQVRSEIRNGIGWQECVCLLFCLFANRQSILQCYLQNLSFFPSCVWTAQPHKRELIFTLMWESLFTPGSVGTLKGLVLATEAHKLQVSLQNRHFAEPAPIEDQGVCPCQYMMLFVITFYLT